MPRKKKNLDSFIIKGNVGDVDNNNGGDNGSKVKSKANSSSVKSDKKTQIKKKKKKTKKKKKKKITKQRRRQVFKMCRKKRKNLNGVVNQK